MALSKFLILSWPRSGRVEGSTALIQRLFDWITASCAGMVMENNEFILAKVR